MSKKATKNWQLHQQHSVKKINQKCNTAVIMPGLSGDYKVCKHVSAVSLPVSYA